MKMNKLSKDEILNYLSVNIDNRKKVMLHNIDDILIVNSLLTEDDLSIIIHNHLFYDALHDYNTPFEDVLNDYFMNHLNIKENSNDLMIWLHSIYS